MAKIKGKFTVEIETEDLAAWMAINNTFTWDRQENIGTKKRLWNGVLIQLGQYEKWEDGLPMRGFGTIKLYSDGQPVGTIQSDAFADLAKPTWINIVVRDQRSRLKDPMTRKHLRNLRIAPPRSLDHNLKPNAGGITLWSENGYRLKVEDNEHHAPHKRFVFTTGDADVHEVAIYMKGEENPGRFPACDRIVISEPEEPSLDHGSHNSPPQEP